RRDRRRRAREHEFPDAQTEPAPASGPVLRRRDAEFPFGGTSRKIAAVAGLLRPRPAAAQDRSVAVVCREGEAAVGGEKQLSEMTFSRQRDGTALLHFPHIFAGEEVVHAADA